MVEPERLVDAGSPEEAALKALGMAAVRGGKPNRLVCRVYWQTSDNTNMVRLYRPIEPPGDDTQRQGGA